MAIEGLSARLLLDEDVDLSLAAALRRFGYDAVHVNELERRALEDEEQLRFAAAERRVLVTHNRQHFVLLADRWWKQDIHHWGIVYARRAPVSELLRRLLAPLDSMTGEELRDLVLPLEAF